MEKFFSYSILCSKCGYVNEANTLELKNGLEAETNEMWKKTMKKIQYVHCKHCGDIIVLSEE
ncbi:MAG: hypothetical protein PHP54_04965 [Clostridia bacterium]|nr:hypothetical protein [Clostridia bacterium]